MHLRFSALRKLPGFLSVFAVFSAHPQELPNAERVLYNHPGLVVDLGVGLWAQPLPMDYDEDGDLDLVVATADVPSNGVYFFENPGGDAKFPVFKPGVRVGPARHNISVSYPEGDAAVATPGAVYPAFRNDALENPNEIESIFEDEAFRRVRADQWKFADYNGDGKYDLVVGRGVWDDYGWDDAYNDQGEWTNGPLHGYVYTAINHGSNDRPQYEKAEQVFTTGGPVDVFGAPSPNFEDFDGDADLDLVCGSFLDSITYFENIGSRTEPKYAPGRDLVLDGSPIRMDLQMLQVVAIDWDRDGDVDLVVGQEDGRVALIEHTGKVEADTPVFLPPVFFQQEADALKIGALCTPVSVDWDNDGDEDLIAGDTAGYLNFVENLDGGNPPRWAKPAYLKAGGETIRIQAGPNGSIQGPAEAKWGYTAPSVADWNHDGLLDIVVNSIWGKVVWFENAGTPENAKLKMAQPIVVAWEDGPPKPEWLWWSPKDNALVTQWRTTPFVTDLNEDGLNDLVMLDHEGYLAAFYRASADGKLILRPGKRVFHDESNGAMRLNDGRAGKSGRRKFVLADWDGDGLKDLLVNSRNVDWFRQTGLRNGEYFFKDEGPVSSTRLAGHTTSPTVVDWNGDGILDLLVGAEDGFLHYVENPRTKN